MKNFLYKISSVLFMFYTEICSAQEFNFNVIVNTEQLTGAAMDKSLQTDMQTVLQSFVNNRKWTLANLTPLERIQGVIQIGLTEMSSPTRFKANIQIQSMRPVYGASYESVLFNFFDKDWDFEYTLGQNIEYSETANNSELANLLSYYLYMVLGMDFDSFALKGGTVYYDKAFQILNNAQATALSKGWRANDGANARYWLIENINSPQSQIIRETNYIYHRKGMDYMTTDDKNGRIKIMEVLDMIKKMNDIKPSTLVMRTFFNTKDVEITNIFTDAPISEKNRVSEILKELDPTNTDKYQKMFKN